MLKAHEIVLWGAGNHTKKLLDNFMNLEKCIDYIVDNNSRETELNGIPVRKPKSSELSEKAIVISADVAFGDIYNELVHKWHVEKNRIFSTHEMMVALLKEKRVLLRPTGVRLELCTLCQLNCAYCYMRVENYSKTGKGYLPFEQFKTFIEKNDFIRWVEISNSGEVFLNPDLKDILLYAAQKGIDITIGNGVNFNTVSDEMLELLVKSKVKFVNISIDGATQEIYEKYRRGGELGRVINHIKRLNYYKKLYKSTYPILQWQYILFTHNECEVEAAIKMSKELDMNIRFKYDCFRDFVPKDPEKLKRLTGLEYLSRKSYNLAHTREYASDVCQQVIFSPQINWDGRLLGCCNVWDEDLGVNVFEQDFVTALNEGKYRDEVLVLTGAMDIENMDIPCARCKFLSKNCVQNEFVYL